VPIAGAADRDYAPDYPGITESNSLHDWDPPFPIDLHLVRPADEQYWKQYRTTPKAFIALARGQQLWGTRFGKLTSIRIYAAIGRLCRRVAQVHRPRANGPHGHSGESPRSGGFAKAPPISASTSSTSASS
jgi:hypothetical protein